MVTKGIKLKLYPNQQQKVFFARSFGCHRFIWNQLLAMLTERHRNNPQLKMLSNYQMDLLLKPLKTEYPFLKEVDSSGLQVVTKNLYLAFKAFFKDKTHAVGQPQFHSRRYARQSYTTKSTVKVLAKHTMQLPKIGRVKVSTTCDVKGKIKRATVVHEPTGNYYLALQVEDDNQVFDLQHQVVGIDVGLMDLAILSTGQKFSTFCAESLEIKLAKAQRKLARRRRLAQKEMAWDRHQKVPSPRELTDFANYQKQKRQVAKIYAKIRNQRNDYLHKLTTWLVKAFDVIVLEDLQVKQLLKNHRLARSIANASWSVFKRQVIYKAEWYGKTAVLVNPRYTSQICTDCGHSNGPKSLAIREWTCSSCGHHHDRDVNAARNILKLGLKELEGQGRALVK
ncbi:MAG TPA: transposase [Candidatus Levilactobacillus faecigallinarum]|uniref:Transposase n=1 Tax=Candidatus Levilactobacillus faecigallinarum TaxID=2838638 RepID=A0A9D1QT60_9LACO|nr:transposase [Candidatus Levilactobacillus faecigallinarum]